MRRKLREFVDGVTIWGAGLAVILLVYGPSVVCIALTFMGKLPAWVGGISAAVLLIVMHAVLSVFVNGDEEETSESRSGRRRKTSR